MEEVRISVDTKEAREWLSQYINKMNNLNEENFKTVQGAYKKYPEWKENIGGMTPSEEFLNTLYKGLTPVGDDTQFEYVVVQEKIPYGTNSVWGGGVAKKSFVKDGNLITEMYQERHLPFICQLDGYNYYLGNEVGEEMTWEGAKEYCNNLGEGWELPPKEIMSIIDGRPRIREMIDRERCWSSTEYDPSYAFIQIFPLSGIQGHQYYNFKTNRYSVLPVYKVKATKLMEAK